MKSNEMYTIQYDANYFGFLRFDIYDWGTGRIIMRILLQGLFRRLRDKLSKGAIPKK